MTEQSPALLARTKDERYRFLGKKGKIISFTSIAVGPENLMKRTPYLVAVIDFGKIRATLPLVNSAAEQIKKGTEVVGVLRRMVEPTEEGVITYGVKCRLLTNN